MCQRVLRRRGKLERVFGALGRPWLKEAGERAQSAAAVVLVCDVVW
jgi:hypothetical protein